MLFNGERRSKRDAYFCALGSIDELNSHLGLARDFVAAAARDSKQQQTSLEDVQLQLYQVTSMPASNISMPLVPVAQGMNLAPHFLITHTVAKFAD